MLKRDFAATTQQIGSPRILIDQPHFVKPVDWVSVINEYQSDIEEKEKKDKLNALANALQTGDEEIINSALAAQNPTGYAERLHQMKLAKEKREQELADKEMQHQRSLALESHRSDLGARRDEAAHERALALEQLKRGWALEDKAREREQALEDEEAERQDFYAQEAFKKELEAQYKKENPEKLPNALYYANELDKLDPNNPAHQPRIKILNGLLEKEMTVANGKGNVAKEIQLLNRRSLLDPNNPAEAEEIKRIDALLSTQKQGTAAKEIQIIDRLKTLDPNDPNDAREIALLESALPGKQTPKDTRTTEEKRYDYAKKVGLSEKDAHAYAMKTGKFAPNQPKPEKTLEQIAAEEKAKVKAKKEAEKEVAEAVARKNIKNKMEIFKRKLARVMPALKSGVGLGEIEYGASSMSRPLLDDVNPNYYEQASLNQQDVLDLNNLMRDIVRDSMATQNISSRQADTQWEQEKMFYDIAPDVDEVRTAERIKNFEEYINQVVSGNPYYSQKDAHQQKKPNKILSITEVK